MNRLFLFCVGGTGARVLKSLLMLLASGVEINATEIIPIIIDPDKDNGNTNEAIQLLNYYQNLQRQTAHEKNPFFKAKISSLGSVESGAVSNNFRMNIVGMGDTHGMTFKDFIQYDLLDYETRAFMQLLYREDKQLNSDLTVGFKGNPHMGAIVLNTLVESADFQKFVSILTEQDRVFIVSSIFGGTGAAGFPLLVKNIRQPDKRFIGRQSVLKSVSLGALTVLPYFGVEPSSVSAIDKSTFITKTKAALSYYERSLEDINALYYIGDQIAKDYKNAEGASAQRNDAHFVETAGALAIVDFMSYETASLQGQHKFKEFGTNPVTATEAINFPKLGARTKSVLAKPLTQLFYALLHLRNRLPTTIKDANCVYAQGNPTTNSVKLDTSLLGSDFFQNNLTPFLAEFERWYLEQAGNQQAFAPFNPQTDQLQHMLQSVAQKKMGWWSGDKWTFDEFDTALNEAEKQMGGLTAAQKLLALYGLATAKIFDERIQPALS